MFGCLGVCVITHIHLLPTSHSEYTPHVPSSPCHSSALSEDPWLDGYYTRHQTCKQVHTEVTKVHSSTCYAGHARAGLHRVTSAASHTQRLTASHIYRPVDDTSSAMAIAVANHFRLSETRTARAHLQLLQRPVSTQPHTYMWVGDGCYRH